MGDDARNLEHSTTSNGVTDNAWHHVAGVYDQVAGENRVYLDGVLLTRTPVKASRSRAPIRCTSAARRVGSSASILPRHARPGADKRWVGLHDPLQPVHDLRDDPTRGGEPAGLALARVECSGWVQRVPFGRRQRVRAAQHGSDRRNPLCGSLAAPLGVLSHRGGRCGGRGRPGMRSSVRACAAGEVAGRHRRTGAAASRRSAQSLQSEHGLRFELTQPGRAQLAIYNARDNGRGAGRRAVAGWSTRGALGRSRCKWPDGRVRDVLRRAAVERRHATSQAPDVEVVSQLGLRIRRRSRCLECRGEGRKSSST